MLITGSELTTIQQSVRRTKSRLLSVVPRTPQFRARVNGVVSTDSTTGSIIAITYDTVTLNTYTSIVPGMTLDVGTTSGGRERGSLRVRSATSSVIYVQETSPGVITIADNDYLTVVEEYLPWLIPVRRVEVLNDAGIATDFTEYHDYDLTYSDQNSAIAPKANIVAGIADDGQGYYLPKLADWAETGVTYRTLTLSGVAAKAVAYGAIINAWLWDVGDCTIVTGLTNSIEITIRVPVGCRYISLTVTDTNGKTQTMRLPLWTHDDSYLPLADFKITSDETEDGRSMRFEFYGADSSLSPAALPRYSTLYYWKNTRFGRTGTAAPRQYRSGVLLWVLKDATTLRHKRKGTYTVEAGGAADWMKSVYGFPQTILDPGETPDVWYEMQHITGVRLLHYVLRTYTTLLDIVNVFLPDMSDEIENFNTKSGTIWSQLVDAAKRAGYHTVGCDSLSGIWMKQEYIYVTSRAARSKTLDLTPAYWAADDPPTIDDDQVNEVGQVVGYGATYDPTITEGEKSGLFGARAPGSTHSYGKGRETAPYQTLPLMYTTATLARWTGEYYARKNNPRKQVRVKLILDADVIEPAWNEPITMTDTRGNLRGLLLSGDEFMPRKVSIRHNYERGKPAEEITLTLEGVTTGSGGVSFEVPTETVTNPPVIVVPPTPPVVRGGDAGLADSTDRIACFDTAGKLHIVRGLRQMLIGIAPTTTTYTLSVTGTVYAFTVRADSSLYLAGSGVVNGYLATAAQVRTIADIFGARTLGAATSLSASDSIKQMQFERGNSLWGIITWYTYGVGVVIRYTIDGGATWSSDIVVNANYNTDPTTNVPPGLWLNPAGNGEALISVYTNTATGTPVTTALYRTIDFGATWAAYGSIDPGDLLATGIVASVADASYFYTTRSNSAISGHDPRLYRNSTDIAPAVGGDYYGLNTLMRSFSVADDDPNAGILCGITDYSGGGTRAVFQTYNLRASTPAWSVIVAPGSSAWRGVYYVNRELAFLIGTNGWLAMLKYLSGVWRIYSYQIPGGSEIVGLCGG